MECECKEKKMVATLQSRKDALEAKLKEKTVELKKLCIQEAELTGILPPETPLESGESPPVFRRRIGTAFTYPENLINKLKSKEEESLAKLELECKIQMSIAEAALGLANDDNANKSIRRKHRLMYQQSQKRLTELETRLNLLRQNVRSNQLKHRKKPRPPLYTENDCVDGINGVIRENQNGTCVKNSYCQTNEGDSLSFVNRDVRATSMYNSFGRSYNVPSTLPIYLKQQNNQSKHDWNYRLSSPPQEQIQHQSAIALCGRENRNWVDDSVCDNIAPLGYYSNQFYGVTSANDKTSRMKSRYGSLDRRRVSSHVNQNYEYDPYHYRYPSSQYASPPQPSPPQLPISVLRQQHLEPNRTSSQNAVLLPNQTYPENSLMRTQSLGNVEQLKKPPDTYSLGKVHENFQSNTLGRKGKEKEWRETSLDSGPLQRNHTPPLHPRANKAVAPILPQSSTSCRYLTNTPPPLPPPPPVVTDKPYSSEGNKSPIKSPTLIDTCVPYESPKNHTVVEVGKWQPYREVTKPFEMSDFYKYSTKFRKNNNTENVSNNVANQNAHNFPEKMYIANHV